MIKELLSFLPGNNQESPPSVPFKNCPEAAEKLREIIPADPQKFYDMKNKPPPIFVPSPARMKPGHDSRASVQGKIFRHRHGGYDILLFSSRNFLDISGVWVGGLFSGKLGN
ncbi:MAG: carboxyl transferase domain-containing protein [Thermodesulfobacteriota bacterium]